MRSTWMELFAAYWIFYCYWYCTKVKMVLLHNFWKLFSLKHGPYCSFVVKFEPCKLDVCRESFPHVGEARVLDHRNSRHAQASQYCNNYQFVIGSSSTGRSTVIVFAVVILVVSVG
jgi:hypothetical protein